MVTQGNSKPCGRTGNRAVSALFRVIGGAGRRCDAEACQHTPQRPMHTGEFITFAIWIPLTVLAASWDLLDRLAGPAAAFLLALPAGFLLLNILPFSLGGKKPASQWRIWLAACTLWACFRLGAGGFTGTIAWGWIALFALNTAAALLLAIGRTMGWSGRPGIAWRMSLLVALHLIAMEAGWKLGWPWAFAGGGCIAAVYCLAVLRPGSQWLGPVRRRTDDGSVLITIDDGPDPHDTPLLLDLLDRHHAKAVFFMIGEKAAAHPDLVREVVGRGHRIGNHTMTHPHRGFWCAGPWRTRREIADCQKTLEEITGVRPTLFRAPCGHRNLFTHPVAAMMGLEVMAWNRRGYDAVEKDASKVLSRILPFLGAGDIVLLHEATPIARTVVGGVLTALDRQRGGADAAS